MLEDGVEAESAAMVVSEEPDGTEWKGTLRSVPRTVGERNGRGRAAKVLRRILLDTSGRDVKER